MYVFINLRKKGFMSDVLTDLKETQSQNLWKNWGTFRIKPGLPGSDSFQTVLCSFLEDWRVCDPRLLFLYKPHDIKL